MGNLGLSFLETRRSVLTRLRGDILQACSEKDVEKLKSLLKENKVATMAEDVETLLLTQDTVLECLRDAGSQASLPDQDDAMSQCHPVESPGFECAGLILAVLLLRKLRRMKGVLPEDAIENVVWSWSPQMALPTLLDEMLGEEGAINTWLDWYRNALRGEHDEEVACFWIAAAVLQLDGIFCHQWTKPFVANALFFPASIIKATISGDQAALRHNFSNWNPYHFMRCVTYFLPHWLAFAQNFGRNNIKTSMRAFEEYFRQANPSLEDFLSSILRLICGDEYINPIFGRRRMDPKIDLVCAYASFFFDAECVSDDALQNMSEYPWVAMGNFTILLNLESINEAACRLCFAAFEKLCQRGCAGLFLMALQDEDTLEEIPSAHRGRLILYLVERQHLGQLRRQVLHKSCELCQHPVVSFYIWMLSHSPLFDSCLDTMEIVSYCSVNCLPFIRKMNKSGIRNMCAMHEESKPDLSVLAFVIRACEAYKQSVGLSEPTRSPLSIDTKKSTLLGHDFSIDKGNNTNNSFQKFPKLW